MNKALVTTLARAGAVAAVVLAVLNAVAAAASSVHLPAADQAVITGVLAVAVPVLTAFVDVAKGDVGAAAGDVAKSIDGALRVFDPTSGHVLTVAPTGAPPQAGPGVAAVVTGKTSPDPAPEAQ